MSQTLHAAVEALVKDCEDNGQPVRGLFALAQLLTGNFMQPGFRQAAERLRELDVDGDRFKLFHRVTIEAWIKQHPLDQDPSAWQDLKLHARRKALIDHPVGGVKEVSMATLPNAWTLVGLASERGLTFLFDQAMVGAPGLIGGGPALGEWIERRTAVDPLGCWVPAFMECDRTHDLVDAAVTGFNQKTVGRVLALLEAQRPDPDTLGRYLAHQAAHTMDAFDDAMRGLEHLGRDGNSPMRDKRKTDRAPHIVGQLLNAGARMTQAQWGGPTNQWLKNGWRAFGKGEERVVELVYPVVANDFDDDTKARTLRRMAAEGHDIVIAHRDRKASRDRFESKTDLPLHLCAAQGHTKSMGVLLDHGADPTALVPQLGMLKTVEMIAEGLGYPECVSVLRSHAARKSAHSILDEIDGLSSFVTHNLCMA